MTIEVYTPRFREALTKLFVGKGGRGGPLTVLDDVMPVYPLVDPEGTEQHYIRSEDLWMAGTLLPLVGAQFGQVAIQNPVGSGAVVVLESFTMSASAATPYAVGLVQGTFGAINVQTYPADLRNQPNAMTIPAVNMAAQAVAPAFAGGAGLLVGNASPVQTLPTPIVITPGWYVLAGLTTANLNLYWAASGYTRLVDPSELL